MHVSLFFLLFLFFFLSRSCWCIVRILSLDAPHLRCVAVYRITFDWDFRAAFLHTMHNSTTSHVHQLNSFAVITSKSFRFTLTRVCSLLLLMSVLLRSFYAYQNHSFIQTHTRTQKQLRWWHNMKRNVWNTNTAHNTVWFQWFYLSFDTTIQ